MQPSRWLGGTAAWLVAAVARAQASPAGAGEIDLLSQLLRTVLALAAVVALIYLLARFGGQRLLSWRGLSGPGRQLRLLERLPVDARHALLLVRYKEDRTFLLGSGEGGLRLVAELTPPPTPTKSFAAVLDTAATAPSEDHESTHG